MKKSCPHINHYRKHINYKYQSNTSRCNNTNFNDNSFQYMDFKLIKAFATAMPTYAKIHCQQQ